jgi:hypothetical protein
MASAFAHFERRFHVIPPEVVLEVKKVFQGILVIGVNRDPSAAPR